MQTVWDLIQRKDWKLEKSRGSDTVHTTTVPNIGKVFKMTVISNVTKQFFFN